MGIPSSQQPDAFFDVKLPGAPYPGLRHFDMHEWPIFLGRETATNEVAGQLIWQQLVVVHGDSGCGKSSFICAGVLAQLEQEHARNDMRWRSITMRPQLAPLENLAQALVGLDGSPNDVDSILELRRILNLGRRAPAALAEHLRHRDGDQICIHVDQFEELFSFAENHDHDEAQLFVDMFVGLHENPPAGLYAILTLNSESLNTCSQFEGLAEAVGRAQYRLPQVERLDLIRAIREPAQLYGGEIARELAERLVADAGDRPNQLPLIQHTLMFLLQRKVGRLDLAARKESWHLGLDDYGGGGGLSALLSAHADEVVASVAPGPDRRRIVQHLFRALVDIDAAGKLIRPLRTFGDLLKIVDCDGLTLHCFVNHFRAEGVSFLIPYGNAIVDDNTCICIGSETLITGWQRLSAIKGLLQTLRPGTQKAAEVSAKTPVGGRDDRNLSRKQFDIFLAYAHQDRKRTGELAERLKGEGYSVFWDIRIPPGETWRSYVFKALSEAKCVIPAWSQHSVKSDWVLEEAEEGKRQRKVVPVLFEGVEPPFGFRFIQAADLSMWQPESMSDVFKEFLEIVAVLVRPGEAWQSAGND